MAERREIDALFKSIMVDYYDPAYVRSTKKNHVQTEHAVKIRLETLDSAYLANIAASLIAGGSTFRRRCRASKTFTRRSIIKNQNGGKNVSQQHLKVAPG